MHFSELEATIMVCDHYKGNFMLIYVWTNKWVCKNQERHAPIYFKVPKTRYVFSALCL